MDTPPIIPKITLPLWAYIGVVVIVGPIAMAWLTDGDIKTAAAGALTTLLGSIGLAVVAVPKIKAAALVHREFNLGAGYAQGIEDSDSTPAAPATPAKRTRSRRPKTS
jgi:hypothetical protein